MLKSYINHCLNKVYNVNRDCYNFLEDNDYEGKFGNKKST